MNKGHLGGERYCGNYATRKVHDLHNEKKKCQIEKTIKDGDEIPFVTLEIALSSGYIRCKYCLADD